MIKNRKTDKSAPARTTPLTPAGIREMASYLKDQYDRLCAVADWMDSNGMQKIAVHHFNMSTRGIETLERLVVDAEDKSNKTNSNAIRAAIERANNGKNGK